MSGGHWNYLQNRLTEVYQDLEEWVEKNGSHERDDWDDLKYESYNPDTVRALLLAAKLTRLVQAAITRADYLYCGDDSEESFLKKWEQELGPVEKLEKLLKEGEK
jgi:hypothetical protein